MDNEESNSIRDYEIYLEQEVVIMLRDGRYLYGVVKSFDQFNSIALDGVIERIFYGKKYAQKRHELFVIRGENISIIGLGPLEVEHDLIVEDFEILSDEISRSLAELQVA